MKQHHDNILIYPPMFQFIWTQRDGCQSKPDKYTDQISLSPLEAI